MFSTRLFNLTLITASLSLTTACETVVNTAPVVDQPRVTPIQPQPDPITDLLLQAEAALGNERLTTPLEDNAYFRYLQVLSLDPDNPAALAGIARIVEIYLSWSLDGIRAGNHRRARSMLNKARSVDEFHPDIPAIERQLTAAETITHREVTLDRTSLANRDPGLASQLQQLGRDIARQDDRVTIIARSDAEGRWIYQQLNAISERRVRATLNLGHDPRILIKRVQT